MCACIHLYSQNEKIDGGVHLLWTSETKIELGIHLQGRQRLASNGEIHLSSWIEYKMDAEISLNSSCGVQVGSGLNLASGRRRQMEYTILICSEEKFETGKNFINVPFSIWAPNGYPMPWLHFLECVFHSRFRKTSRWEALTGYKSTSEINFNA